MILEFKWSYLAKFHKSQIEDGREGLPIESKYLLADYVREEDIHNGLNQIQAI